MKRPLEGIRVVEAAEMVAGPYCGKILADLGAEVIKLEAPGAGDAARLRGPFLEKAADPDRSLLFLYLNLGKMGITLNLRESRGRRIFLDLIQQADILIEDVPPGQKAQMGLDPGELRKVAPKLVHISITALGNTGPYRDFKTHHLNRYMAGGDGSFIFVREEDLDRPPIQGPGYLADYEAGVGAAVALLGGLIHRDASGEGQFIDFSAQEWCIHLSGLYLLKYPNEGLLMDRNNSKYSLGGIMGCRDGYVMLLLFEDHHWWRLIKAMGDPSWAFEERFDTHYKRIQHRDEINAMIRQWLGQHSKHELYHMLQKRGVPCSPIHAPREVLASPQLRSRQFFLTRSHPVVGQLRVPSIPYRFSECAYANPRPAPGLGEHNVQVHHTLGRSMEEIEDLRREGPIRGPTAGLLSGIRVTDFTWALAGPFCTEMVALMGGEVIKIENRKRPDLLRRISSALGLQDEGDLDRSVEFNGINLNKKSIGLDLAHPTGVEIAKKLIALSDVVVENFSPGVMEKLGLDYGEVRKIKPDVIMVSISYSGQTGPETKYLGYAPLFHAVSGLAHLTGYPDSPPGYIRVPIDSMVGSTAAVALLAAIHHRRRTGQGQYIDLSAREAMSVLIGHHLIEAALGMEASRSGNEDEGMVPHDCYPCLGEHNWISIAVEGEAQWKALCEALGHPSLACDPRFSTPKTRRDNREALDEALSGLTATFDLTALTHALQEAGVAAFPAMRASDIFSDPHLKARGFFTDVNHPVLGRQRVFAPPWKFSAAAPEVTSAAPLLGQHSEYVLKELLGMGQAQVEELRREGVIC